MLLTLEDAKQASVDRHDATLDLPRKVQVALNLADKLLSNGKFEKAFAMLMKQAKDLPKESNGYLAISATAGIALIQQGDIQTGYDMLKSAWQHLPHMFSISINFGFQACAVQDPLAESALRESILSMPTTATLWDALADTMETKYIREKEEEIIAYYTIAWELDNSMACSALGASRVCEGLGDFEQAEMWAKRAIKADPDSPEGYEKLALMYFNSGRPRQSLPFLDLALGRLNIETCSIEMWSRLYQVKATISSMLDSTMNSLPYYLQGWTGAWGMYDRIDTHEHRKACLALPLRLRFYRTCLSSPDGPEYAARKLMEQTKIDYAKVFPSDIPGQRMIAALLGDPLPRPVQEEIVTQAPTTIRSHMCEMILLHLCVQGSQSVVVKPVLAKATEGSRNLVPFSRVYTSQSHLDNLIDEYMKEQQEQADNSNDFTSISIPQLWFFKHPNLQRGFGITISTYNPTTRTFTPPPPPPHPSTQMVAQAAVDPALIDGKKFGVRVHVLCVAMSDVPYVPIFLFTEGILTICGKEYKEHDIEKLAQVSCTSVMRGMEGYDRDKVKGPASKLWEHFDSVIPKIQDNVLQVLQCAENTHFLHRIKTPASPSSEEAQTGVLNLQMFGVDLIFRSNDNQPLFIEANSAPQFQDAFVMESLKHTFGMPMVAGSADVVEDVARSVKDGSMSKDKFVRDEKLKASSWMCCGTVNLKDASKTIKGLDANLFF